MKVTNISALKIYLKDLKTLGESQTEGRRGEDRYLAAGASVYLPDTDVVLRSCLKGDLRNQVIAGKITLNDQVTLAASASSVLAHDFRYMPAVSVCKKVGSTWVDATGTYNLVHDLNFTQSTIQNATGLSLTFMIRIS